MVKGARYHRVDQSGPRETRCSWEHPFVCQYFTCAESEEEAEKLTLKELERKMFKKEEGRFFMAHNGEMGI